MSPAKQRTGQMLLAGCGLVLVLLTALALVIQSRPQRDPVTGCPPRRQVRDRTAVLLDFTDPLSAEQRQSLHRRLRSLSMNDLRPNEQVSVWILGEGDNELRRIYCRCFPGREANPLWSNLVWVAARAETTFMAPLSTAVATAAAGRAIRRSAIMESVRQIAELEDLAPVPGARRLVLVSDLRQNNGALSHDAFRPDFSSFRQSAAFPPVRAQLAGVDVELVFVARAKGTLAEQLVLQEFWKRYFLACGATTVKCDRL